MSLFCSQENSLIYRNSELLKVLFYYISNSLSLDINSSEQKLLLKTLKKKCKHMQYSHTILVCSISDNLKMLFIYLLFCIFIYIYFL